MKLLKALALLVLASLPALGKDDFYSLEVTKMDGKNITMSEYRGKVRPMSVCV